jgi:cysteinyl-tRNA synthetase
MLKIYNTFTKQKEEFKPINPPNVKMYMCGPTVYDYFHIGNARSFINADIIRRYLEYRGYKVKFVMNITDVDDKIIKKSNEEKITAEQVAKKYINAFFEDLEKLKIKRADVYPKATKHMQDIIGMIKELEEKGFAYNINGNVFFDVNKFNEYGKLSGKKLDELEVGARIEVNEEKKNPLDFSLWKKAKEGEPYWESPWGNGRPGWHIECSAMSCKHLGDNFDIHAGGNDLIFPHHENEIAQSEAANNKKFVNYWIHFGFLNIDNEKMSKSLGNFFTARDVLKKYPAEAIRSLFAQTNYGGPLNFSDELLTAANKGLEKISNLNERIKTSLSEKKNDSTDSDFDFDKYEKEFIEVMDDDFNAPKGVAVIFDFVRDVNRFIDEKRNLSGKFYELADNFLIKTAEGVFGILPPLTTDAEAKLNGEAVEKLSELAKEINPDAFNNLSDKSAKSLIDFLITERLNAKKNKNFASSDKIRDEMKNCGIILQDSKEKTTYKVIK